MNKTSTSCAAFLLAGLASVGFVRADVPTIVLPPFTFVGRIADYSHIAYDSNTKVEIRVKAQDGTLLCKGTTWTSGKTSYNYRIDVPLASATLSRHVKAGDTVVFEFVDPDGRIYTGLVPEGEARLGAPGECRRLDVLLATDADGDGVADEYVESLGYMMWEYGITRYEADKDYDGDGQSNFAEYVAGTNPFDATDSFSVREMAVEKGLDGYMALKVPVTQGRNYRVVSSARLGGDVRWAEIEFSVEDPAAALQKRLVTEAGELGYRILYVKKSGSERFYRLEVE